MTPHFDGRLVVVTGVAHRGQVGEVVARALATQGATLALLDRNRDEAEARAAELRADGLTATAWPCDLTDHAALGAVAASLAGRHSDGVAALVCLAGGFGSLGPVGESDPAQWERALAVNLATAYATTRAFVPALRRARGSIVYFASAAVAPGGRVAGIAGYAAAKAGVVALMRAVAAEERPHGVRANALAPNSIRTDANVAAMGNDASYVERETVADWVTFLCSPTSGPIFGQLIQLG
ncbi:MAG: SDR family oxidoreductase [Gemmatimonadetes bacterium]|nr:SDR family oxidoreductase [Gemmatimonadota bacterium]MCC6769585.1 SDR family oxidoreductase [Gemmatimonadaceae bacterium]